MNAIIEYLNSLIIKINTIEKLDFNDLENLLYIIFQSDKNPEIVTSLLSVILYNYFVLKEEKEPYSLENIYSQVINNNEYQEDK